VAAIALVVVAIVALPPAGHHDGSRVVVGSTIESTVPTPGPSTSVLLQRPRITSFPSVGLRDGDSVSITGSGFPPSSTVTINVCADDPTLGRGRCDTTGTAVELRATRFGTIQGTMTVREWIFAQDGFIDCGHAPANCALLPIDANGPGSGQPIQFGTAVAQPEPILAIDAAGPYRQNEQVRVVGLEFPPGVRVSIGVCEARVPSSERHCVFPSAGVVNVDSQGRFTVANYTLIAGDQASGLDCLAPGKSCDIAWYPAVGTPAYAALHVNFAT
jgi:hypothetical protein